MERIGPLRRTLAQRETSRRRHDGLYRPKRGRRYVQTLPVDPRRFGPRHIGLVPDALETAMSGDEKIVLLDDDPRELHELRFAPLERQFPWKASVMISHGCDNFCTYCIVPYVRGRFASRSPREIMSEAEQLVEGGVKEICLLGQNVDTYGKDLDRYSFADLLNDVAHIKGLERLRFMTSYPTDFTKDVVDAIAGNANICPAINLPIQAGSDRILKR